MKKVICILSAIFLTASNIAVFAAVTPVMIRVCVIENKPAVKISLDGAYKIYDVNTNRVVMEGGYLTAAVKPTDKGLLIGSKEIVTNAVNVKTKRDSNIYVEGRRFRGNINIIRKDASRITVVNNLDIESYLYGVLYHEVSHRWPMEILKAQAITARTFALYQARQSKLQLYDVRSDIYSQVYGGRTSEKWRTTKAVNLTRGKVLAYKGVLFPSYYHATCGGYTEDASNLWKVDLPVLKEVKCDYCKNSPHYNWSKSVPLKRIEDKLKEGGYKLGEINSIAVLSRNKSGRVDKLEIKDKAGVSIVMTGKDFRYMIGPNELRSARFEVTIKRGDAMFKGSGWGHGVGMCQWGAYDMARRGSRAEDILKFYYPDSEVTTLDKV